MAALLPKLRAHFAEFLNNASPVGLRILSSSTCVGLRYGYVINDSGFSRQLDVRLRYYKFAPRYGFSLHEGFASHADTPLGPVFALPAPSLPSASPQFCYHIVQESKPVVHRLRLSTSP